MEKKLRFTLKNYIFYAKKLQKKRKICRGAISATIKAKA